MPPLPLVLSPVAGGQPQLSSAIIWPATCFTRVQVKPLAGLGWAGLGWLGVTNISIVCPLHSSARRNISNQQPASRSRVIQKFLSQLIFIFHDNK